MSSTDQPASGSPAPPHPDQPAGPVPYPYPAAFPPPGYGSGRPGRPAYLGYQGYPGHPGYGYHPPARPTNGLAIAALVISIAAFPAACVFYGVPGLLGAVGAALGHVARRQIRQNGEAGDGLALAGIITGWVVTGLAIVAILVIAGLILWAVSRDLYALPG